MGRRGRVPSQGAHENGAGRRPMRGRHTIRDLQVENYDISDHRLTENAVLLGSPSYIAPDQMSDTRSVDGRADLGSRDLRVRATHGTCAIQG